MKRIGFLALVQMSQINTIRLKFLRKKTKIRMMINEVININIFLTVLHNMPDILQYFCPGIWCILLFSFLCSRKFNTKLTVGVGCIFSYLSISIISLFIKTDNVMFTSAISFLTLTVLSVLVSVAYYSHWGKRMLTKFFHRTQYKDIWHDILDLKKGSNLKVYFKNNSIGVVGHHVVHEENGNESWMAVCAPIKFDVNTDEAIDERHKDSENVIVTFKLKDVEHIEVFNSSNTIYKKH